MLTFVLLTETLAPRHVFGHVIHLLDVCNHGRTINCWCASLSARLGRAREHDPSLLGQRGHREEPIKGLTDAVIKGKVRRRWRGPARYRDVPQLLRIVYNLWLIHGTNMSYLWHVWFVLFMTRTVCWNNEFIIYQREADLWGSRSSLLLLDLQ